MTKDRNYWEGRHKQWLKNQERMDENVSKRLKKEYIRISKELEKEIAAYFQKYGKDNVIEFRIMMEQLSDEEREMLFEDMNRFAEEYAE